MFQTNTPQGAHLRCLGSIPRARRGTGKACGLSGKWRVFRLLGVGVSNPLQSPIEAQFGNLIVRKMDLIIPVWDGLSMQAKIIKWVLPAPRIYVAATSLLSPQPSCS